MTETLSYAQIKEEIKKAEATQLPKLKISVLSNVTVGALGDYLKYFSLQMGYGTQLSLGEYDQLLQDSLRVELFSGNDATLLVLDLRNLSPLLCRHQLRSAELIQVESERINELINHVIKNIRKHTGGLILLTSLVAPKRTQTTVLDRSSPLGLRQIVKGLNEALFKLTLGFKDIHLIDMDSLVQEIGQTQFFDERYWHMAKSPFSFGAQKLLAQESFRYIRALKSKNKKVLVLDADNTLWGGILGEDGKDKIKLGPDFPGSLYYEFQNYIGYLNREGVILALCSKNNEEDVWTAIQAHPFMLLRREHFAAAKINWDDKAQNIQKLSQELNIKLDQFVFVDDSPFECELVRGALPQVETLQLTREVLLDPSVFLGTMFDTINKTSEDAVRTQMYQDENLRNVHKKRFSDLQSYIESLEIRLELLEVSESYLPRVSQLTQKTNQFNFTTIRYTEQEISDLMASSEWELYCLNVADKFGDYGITGVAFVRIEANVATIETFLLSCRVLGRGVEDKFLSLIVERIKSKEVRDVFLTFRPSAKNQVAREFLERVGRSLSNNYEVNQELVLPLNLEQFAENQINIS